MFSIFVIQFGIVREVPLSEIVVHSPLQDLKVLKVSHITL
jgi:hypothetical protein